MTPNLNLWLIPVLPLIGAALNGLFGKRLTRQAVVTVALAFSGTAFGLALFVAVRFSTLELPHVETVAQWIRAGNFRADFAFYLDQRFLIALFLLIKHFGSLDFMQVFQQVSSLGPETTGAGLLTAIGLLLMVGAAGKSAQLPLYVWLPDAMEGPTPVSALIHAATMVTAGVYMVTRHNAIYQLAPLALDVVAVIGALTAIYAASMGLVQNDIKRILAYSTISQHALDVV